MIIKTSNHLDNATPANARYLGLTEKFEGFFYVTNDVEALRATHPGVTIEDADSRREELRKTLEAALGVDAKTEEKIRAKYSISKEMQALRTNDAEYKTFIEQVVAEHNAAKDALFSL
jgi:hypothetical protein